MKNESGGLMLRFRSNPWLAVLIFLLLGCVVVMAFIVAQLLTYSDKDQHLRDLVAELRASSYQLTSLSRDATSGNKQAFERLSRLVARMDNTWNQFKESDAPTKTALNKEMTAYEGVWSRIRQNSQVITENEAAIILMHDVATTLNEALPQLQAEHDNIVEILLENRAPAEQVSMAQRQSWFAERIGRNVDKMLRGGLDADRAADEFNIDANRFGKVLEAMKKGDATMGITKVSDRDAVDSLQRITELFAFVSGSVRDIFEKSPALFSARQATNAILDGTPLLLERLGDLNERIDALPDTRRANNTTLLIAGALALIILIAIGLQLNQATNRRLKVTAETNERNQNAILRLLDELADLADGDLTTTATVTEDFTGAIADSINYTIDQLRVLVSRINETSARVASAAQETQQTALHLAEASEHQAQEIAGASAAVNEMAVTIDQVSANAAESAGVAERSVSIANNGAKVVQNTIHGMDTIREQIQETSKRIKRLGESSQEIGDIVSLINDIADQTNILALNAAIQASMAGDAGRGFAVVADEVQRLAERSATATKQIEALVKTIQNDTNEAVISMEQTTAEVVRGARLAQDAGVALEEIETVSANLAELIQNISNAARQQAASAGHISNTMNVIQEITSQTSAGTSATAAAIGNLAGMAIKLRESVAGFKLPEEMSGVDADVEFTGASAGRSRFARSADATLVMEDEEDADAHADHQSSGARG
jgi:twitching motility protein PilJ